MSPASLAPPPPTKDRRWQLVKNDDGQTIPAYGLVIVTGADQLHDMPVLKVTLPSAATDAMSQLIGVAYSPIKAGNYGWITCQWPAYVSYDTGNTPAFGELWGPAANSAQLAKGNDGFMILSSSPLSSPDRVLVHFGSHFHKPLFIRGELDADLATTDATASSITILERFSGTTDGVTDPTSVNNPAASSDYLFDGVTNDVFLAFYDWNDSDYTIFQKECT